MLAAYGGAAQRTSMKISGSKFQAKVGLGRYARLYCWPSGPLCAEFETTVCVSVLLLRPRRLSAPRNVRLFLRCTGDLCVARETTRTSMLVCVWQNDPSFYRRRRCCCRRPRFALQRPYNSQHAPAPSTISYTLLSQSLDSQIPLYRLVVVSVYSL